MIPSILCLVPPSVERLGLSPPFQTQIHDSKLKPLNLSTAGSSQVLHLLFRAHPWYKRIHSLPISGSAPGALWYKSYKIQHPLQPFLKTQPCSSQQLLGTNQYTSTTH